MAELPTSMTAISIREPGGPDVLVPIALPVPAPSKGEVLIAVKAAGVNRPDVLQRLGGYPPPPGAPETPGLEISGEVVALGEGVSQWQNGDAVCALVSGGGYAEYAVADAGHCLAIPKGFSHNQAAALPETVFTVWHNVFQRGGLKSGESFLVHGGTSGIGTVAIQLAKARGATVFATAGSEEKCAACLDLGADLAINYRNEDFVERVKDATDGKGVDLTLDMVGGSYIQRNIIAAAMDGRIVQIAFLGGPKAEVNFTQLMLKRLTLTGSTLRARSREFKEALAQEVQREVWPLIETDKFAPVMHAEFPLVEAAKAHAMMEESKHVGKIVLSV
ncbi:NAD(P)H-quinone oxidoreductase [Pseudahrensia aquimaris]|uniref:NAD(P)H-quinone oxidoreductase n=1 Tax=Pseudahrensia aquimaris TaxID=744461 RepID=A0ABW3FBS8_9HYPH